MSQELFNVATNGVKHEEHQDGHSELMVSPNMPAKSAARKRVCAARIFGSSNCYLRGVKIDIPMLKIIHDINPWDNGTWKQVVDAMAEMGVQTTVRNVRRRVERLCSAYISKDMASLNKCGSVKQHRVRTSLIAKVQRLRESSSNLPSVIPADNMTVELHTPESNNCYNDSANDEHEQTESLSPTDAETLETVHSAVESLTTPHRFAPEPGDSLAVLKLKFHHELEREKLQMDANLQKEKLELEKKRLELEEKRLYQESKRDDIMMAMVETHQAILKRMDEKYEACFDAR